MAQTQVNFDCEDTLKSNFETAIKQLGFSHMAEAFRDYMRSTVRGVASDGSSIKQNPKSESQEEN